LIQERATGRRKTMLTHQQIGTALDRLAERAGLSLRPCEEVRPRFPPPSTKSKRITGDGPANDGPPPNRVEASRHPTSASTVRQLIDDGARRRANRTLLGFGRRAPALVRDDGGFRRKGGPIWASRRQATKHCYALGNSCDSSTTRYRDGGRYCRSPGTPIAAAIGWW